MSRLPLIIALLLVVIFGVSTAAAMQAPPLQLVSAIKEISVPLFLMVLSAVGAGAGVAYIGKMMRAPVNVGADVGPALERVAKGLEGLNGQFNAFLITQAEEKEPRRRAMAQTEEVREMVCELHQQIPAFAQATEDLGNLAEGVKALVGDRRQVPRASGAD